MAFLRRPLRPSYRSRTNSREKHTNPPPADYEHRRCCRRWGAAPLERTLLGYVLSLALLVALVNLPIRGNFLGGRHDTVFTSRGLFPDEALTLITVHDLPEEHTRRSPTSDSSIDTEMNQDRIPDVTPIGTNASASRDRTISRAEGIRPVAVSNLSGIPTANESRKLLRHTFGPPAVDDPPRVRVGSMMVRYPLSALKKAIEGLVIVRFTVETSGRASSVSILKGLDPACDAEVVQAIENASFFPGRKDGREVPAYSQMTVRFVLANSRSGLAYQ